MSIEYGRKQTPAAHANVPSLGRMRRRFPGIAGRAIV